MKGSNTFVLNEATMMEAIQFWLNSKMINAPKVTGINIGREGFSKTFDILLSSEAEEEG